MQPFSLSLFLSLPLSLTAEPARLFFYAPCYLSLHIIELSLLFHTFVLAARLVHVISGLAF
jgi:hypothetical protein